MKQSGVHRRVTGHSREGQISVYSLSVVIGMLIETSAPARTDLFFPTSPTGRATLRYATLRSAALCFWSILGSVTPLSHANKFVPD